MATLQDCRGTLRPKLGRWSAGSALPAKSPATRPSYSYFPPVTLFKQFPRQKSPVSGTQLSFWNFLDPFCKFPIVIIFPNDAPPPYYDFLINNYDFLIKRVINYASDRRLRVKVILNGIMTFAHTCCLTHNCLVCKRKQ